MLLLACGREFRLHDHRAVIAGAFPDVSTESVDETIALQQRDQAARAGIGNEIGDEAVGLGGEIGARGRHDKFQRQLPHFLDRFNVRHAQCGFAWQKRRCAHHGGHRAARNAREETAGQFFEFIQRRLAGQRQRHAVGRVLGLVECAYDSGCGAGQRVFVSGREFALAAARRV